jgi:hypothetical protein
VEGQTIALEGRWAEGKFDRPPSLAAELVRLKVDILVTSTTPAVQAAQQATKTIHTIWRDIEPDEPQAVPGFRPWSGRVTMAERTAWR